MREQVIVSGIPYLADFGIVTSPNEIARGSLNLVAAFLPEDEKFVDELILVGWKRKTLGQLGLGSQWIIAGLLLLRDGILHRFQLFRSGWSTLDLTSLGVLLVRSLLIRLSRRLIVLPQKNSGQKRNNGQETND